MILKEKLNIEPGFKYVVDSMELMSSAGHRMLMQQPFLTDAATIEREFDNLQSVIACMTCADNASHISVIRHQLMQMHDLHGTLSNLEHHIVLEEVELFELKSLAFLCIETVKASECLGISEILDIPSLVDVFRLLDPDNTNIPNFYIYDSYHPELAPLRKELRAKQSRLDAANLSADEVAELQTSVIALFDKQNGLQQKVISVLCDKLHAHHAQLQKALERMAYTDVLFAKATLAMQWRLTRPRLTVDAPLSLTGLWNPRLKQRNEEQGLRYQPVDITLHRGVCLITGANMAGKTVLLKSVGIVQMMAQFGMFVPAESAMLPVVDDVAFCIGDEQNEMNGLSSFASEILKISDLLERSDRERMLVLIDEPARTTNPVEGKAIVQAIAAILDARSSTTLITTHYSQLGLGCRRLRVKGFVSDMLNESVTPDNINKFMDYSLLEDSSDDVPHEAIRIATLLKCYKPLLDSTVAFLEASGDNR